MMIRLTRREGETLDQAEGQAEGEGERHPERIRVARRLGAGGRLTGLPTRLGTGSAGSEVLAGGQIAGADSSYGNGSSSGVGA
jgi:hypothetical protein